ncbi:MAG TPA: hypothetical protein VN914_16430 [Polyangia bacterium]|nr:hypothetical protein [Polyangia bacterium]
MLALVRKATVVLLVTIWFLPGPAPAHAAAAPRPPTEARPAAHHTDAPSAATTTPRPGSAADVERFAERERQAIQLESFEGGSSIGTTSIIIILLLVIVLVLVIR